MPAGSAAPSDETPKAPPATTPLGSVVFRSSVAPLPTAKYKGPTTQAAGGRGLGEGAGAGAGAGSEFGGEEA